MATSYYKIVLALGIVLGAIACSKFSFSSAEESPKIILTEQEAALQDFAVLLSKAIYNEPELRLFIKSKAIERYDRDNDVFYPWVKDEKLSDGRSIKEILSSYDDSGLLATIEQTVPLLNILVPDWSWIHSDCFSPSNWDTDITEVGIGYRSREVRHKVYCNGKLDYSLDPGEFPTDPVLIVKANERMKIVSPATKGSDAVFEFRSADYDGSIIQNEGRLETKGSDTYVNHELDYTTANLKVYLSSLPYRLENVLAETALNDTLAQRDYLYYNMTATRDTGVVNIRYTERILKFKLNPNIPQYYNDPFVANTTHRDYKLKEYYYVGSNTALTNQQMSDMLWADGALDIRITTYCGTHSWSSVFPVDFQDAFSIKKVREHRRYNSLGALKSRTYYLGMNSTHSDADEWLSPKWINANISLFNWDLSEKPTSYEVKFIEEDESTTSQYTHVHSYERATNFSLNATLDSLIKVGFAYGVSEKISDSNTFIETHSTTDYVLGWTNVFYTDQIITAINNGWLSSTATLKKYSINAVDFVVLPTYQNN